MCSVMIAIEYSYKLDTKKDFNLWCELGQFLHRQSHLLVLYMHNKLDFQRKIFHELRSCHNYFKYACLTFMLKGQCAQPYKFGMYYLTLFT